MKVPKSMYMKSVYFGFMVFAFFGIFFQTVQADGWSLVGSSSATGTVSVALPITDIQISGGSTSSVPVKLRVTSGTLQMATTTGLSFTGSQTGSTLYFSGTRDDVNNALASLTYTRGSTGTDTLEVSLVEYGEVFFADNGHLYEYVSYTSNWNTAKTQAEARTKYGATGYLVTVGSQAENDFVAARLLNAGWMGASDSSSEGAWRWVTGPENGTQFWSGASGGSTVGGNYANWGTGEPNDSGGEDCAQFLTGGSGKWNDLPCSTYNLPGYVVEYGAPGNLPTVTAKNVLITTLSTPTASSFSPLDNSTSVGTSTNLTITFSQPVYAGSGTLAIWDYTNLLVHQPTTIDDTSIISGLGTNSITINPSQDFSESTDYYVIIDSNAFKNASNAYYAGFTSTTTWNFRTGDFTAPTISSVTATSTSSTTLTISWSTNELSSSRVSYDSHPLYFRDNTAESDTSPRVTSHSVTLTDLIPCTWYQYRVHSVDAASNSSTSSVREVYTSGCAGTSEIRTSTSTPIDLLSNQQFTSSDGTSVVLRTVAYFYDASSTPVFQIMSLLSSSVLSELSRPSGYTGIGTEVFDIRMLNTSSDSVTTVLSPVTVVLKYEDPDIAGIDENSLRIFNYHNGVWSVLDSCSVDTASNKVTCTTTRFSIFGIFGTPRVASVSGPGPAGITPMYGCRDQKAKNFSSVVAHKQSACVYSSQSNVSTSSVQVSSSKKIVETQKNDDVPLLYLGVKHPDVVLLQRFLNSHGFTIASTGPGSAGNETDMFGVLTRRALIRFQESRNIKPAIGFFGPITRAVVNSLK